MKEGSSKSKRAKARLEKLIRMQETGAVYGEAGTADATVKVLLRDYFREGEEQATKRGQAGTKIDAETIFNALDRLARGKEVERPAFARYLREHYEYGHTRAHELVRLWEESRAKK